MSKKLLILVLLLLVMAPRVARGDEPRPWADGVSAERQARALELFTAANQAFAHSDYAGAARLYRQALESWDHPAIHGNLAVALINLDDPLSAYEHLEAALRWGEAPFEAGVYAQLTTNHKLLEGQLSHIEVVCDVAGATVTLDGEQLLVGRGRVTRTVRAGSHQVVARKASHLTFTSEVSAFPGEPVQVKVVLVPLAEAGGWERRFPTWVPWTVVGGGAALLAVGLGFQSAAEGNIDAYEQEIALECPDGCVEASLPAPVRDLVPRARWQNRLGVGAMVLGGAAIVGGGLLLYLNQPRRVRLEESGKRIGAAPLFGDGVAGIVVHGRF